MKRMFRVALSYTVAVEAVSDADAIRQAQFMSAYECKSTRKLQMSVLSSWLDKAKDVEDVPEFMPEMPASPAVPTSVDDIPF
jgi:hypothetical protein